MRFLLILLLTALAAALLQSFLPWWSSALAAFVVAALSGGRALSAFLAGFLGIGLMWFLYAFYLDAHTDSILSPRIAWLFFAAGNPQPKGLPASWLVMLISAVIGGLPAGFAALSGNLLWQWRKAKKTTATTKNV